MTTFNWGFPQSEVVKSQDGLTNVVIIVHWILAASDEGYEASACGVVPLERVTNPDDFTPFEDLTKQQVEDWVISALNRINKQPSSPKNPMPELPPYVDLLKESLSRQIADMKNPPVETLPFDFGG